VKKYEYLRDLIANGRAKPSTIVSHRIDIDDVSNAYKKVDERTDGYSKVLIRFVESKSAAAAD
jgi:glutathione-independent formaldehyde dehydrogenase